MCDMQAPINQAADESILNRTSNSRQIFDRLVAAEQAKEQKKGILLIKGVRAPYKTRAALGLILLLSSTL